MNQPFSGRTRTRFQFTLTGVLLLVAGYALVHATTRLLASGNLGEDDPLDNLWVQTLAPGYSLEHGPFYDWLLWVSQHLLGTTGLPSFLAVKYGLLVAMAGGLFSMTRRLTGSPLWGFVAVESMAAVYQIFWRFHEGFTHRAGAMALVVFTLWAALRIVDRPSLPRYALLAVLFGAGLISEHIYVVFVGALLIAAWSQPPIRRALLSPKLAAMLPLTALVAAPYASWLCAEPGRLAAFFGDLLPAIPAPSAHGLMAGLRDALTFPIFVMAPWSVVAPLVFPAIFRTARTSARDDLPAPIRFVGRLLLIEIALHVLFNGIVFAKAGYPVHSILPMMMIAIPWLTAKIAATEPTAKRIRVYMAILLAFTITAYAVRSGNLFVYEPFCSRCRWGTPYAGLAEELRGMGFTDGAIISNDVHTAGNLRRFFPQARIGLGGMSAELPAGTPVMYVWLLGADGTPPPGVAADAHRLDVPWHAPLKPAGHRTTHWAAELRSAP